VCLTDSPYLEKTLRHIFRSLKYPFKERLIALDKSEPQGGFRRRDRDDETRLTQILQKLHAEKLFDRIDEIPWTEENQKTIFRKFFNQENLDPRCIHGTAVYQYLYALDQCQGDYILHVDSDMLFSMPEDAYWIDEGIRLMSEKSDVVFVTPIHPPKAETFLEYLLGRPLQRNQQRWILGQTVSTRYFLVDRRRMETKLLPFLKGDETERLEQSFIRTLKAKGFFKGTLNSMDTWVIHPKPHNENYVNHLDTLIWAVENHIYPFRRLGRYPWDLSTYSHHLWPWLRAARKAKKSRTSYASP
jgi:hypothetical protein